MKCMHEGCKEKLRLIKFTCKCEKHFCIKHKDPETHSCNFDFKKIENMQQIINDTKCVPIKIKSI